MTRTTIRLTDTVTGQTMTLKKVVFRQTADFRPAPVYAMTAPMAGGKVHRDELRRADVKAILADMKGRVRISREG